MVSHRNIIANTESIIASLGLSLRDSMGNKPLDRSCIDAIGTSRNFGPVPKDLLEEGKVLVIPFIFGYYVY